EAMRKLLAVLSMLALWGIDPTPLRADAVGWHDKFGGDAGLGLDLRNQTITKPRVALFGADNLPQYDGTGEQSLNIYFAQHRLNMLKSFSLNANVSMQYAMFSGSAGFNFIDT